MINKKDEINADRIPGLDAFTQQRFEAHVTKRGYFGSRKYRRMFTSPPPRADGSVEDPGQTPNRPEEEKRNDPSPASDNLAPAEMAQSRPDNMTPACASIKLQVHLAGTNIKNKAELIRVLEIYAHMTGVFFCPLIKPFPSQARGILPDAPVETYEFNDMSYAILLEHIGDRLFAIKCFQRRKAPRTEDGNGYSDWYPLCRKD